MPSFLSQALVLRGLKVLALNTVIAIAITLFDNHSFGLNLRVFALHRHQHLGLHRSFQPFPGG